MKVGLQILALSAAFAAMAGCGGGSGGGVAPPSGTSSTTSTTATASGGGYTPPNVPAGLPVSTSTDMKPYLMLVASADTRFHHRGDPFLLTSEEAAYDRQQNTERVLGTMGGWTTEYEAPAEESKEVVPDEPQPYRRLAGIVVGDSVLAIIDMGDGRAATIIRPGMKIPNTEWTVVSIDEDKAVLHRDGPVGPHTISVRLESPPPGFGGQSGFPGSQNGAAGGPGRPRGGPAGGPSFGGMAPGGGGGGGGSTGAQG